MLQQGPPPAIPPSQPRDWTGRAPYATPTPTSSRSIPVSAATLSATRRLSASTRHAVGGGPGLERRRPVPRLERHPEQRADALDGRRRPRHGLPQPVGLQQRQHLRLSRAASCPASTADAASPLRADGRSRSLPTGSTASASTRRTTSSSTPMAASGSPIRRTASSATTKDSKASRRRRRPSIASTRSGQLAMITDEVTGPTASASRTTTSGSMSPTPARAARSACSTSTASARNGRRYTQLTSLARATPSFADGIRCDADGNVWAGARPGV